jgi:hypothetical protein
LSFLIGTRDLRDENILGPAFWVGRSLWPLPINPKLAGVEILDGQKIIATRDSV